MIEISSLPERCNSVSDSFLESRCPIVTAPSFEIEQSVFKLITKKKSNEGIKNVHDKLMMFRTVLLCNASIISVAPLLASGLSVIINK